MSLVIHPHFHRRRTGVTRHVEEVVTALNEHVETRVFGTGVLPEVPHIGFGELWRRMRTEPVVWHAHRNNELLTGFLLRLLMPNLKVVFTRHGPRPPSRFSIAIGKRADRLVTLTRRVAREMVNPSEIVSHGVDLTRFHPPADREAAFRALGLGGRFGIGVVGRVRPNKGQGDFVEAIRPLLDEHPDWRALLVGLARGPDQSWAEKLRKSTGDRLVLAGEQREIVPWYQGLTVLVQPSYHEAYSMVLIESMAAGCCVVATALEQHPEVIDHGRTGFLYEPGNVEELRSILTELMKDPDRARKIGQQAAEEARKRFGVEHEVRGLMNVYAQVLGGLPRLSS